MDLQVTTGRERGVVIKGGMVIKKGVVIKEVVYVWLLEKWCGYIKESTVKGVWPYVNLH